MLWTGSPNGPVASGEPAASAAALTPPSKTQKRDLGENKHNAPLVDRDEELGELFNNFGGEIVAESQRNIAPTC